MVNFTLTSAVLSIVFSVVFGSSSSASTFATRLGVTATALVANPAIVGESRMSANSNTSLGGGVLLGIPLTTKVEIEPGVFYLNRSFISGTAKYSTQLLQFPVLARVWPINIFSIGLGPYFSTDVGGYTTGYDWGGMLAAGFDIPIQKSFGFILDGRFSQSLRADAIIADSTWRYRDAQVLAGLRFTLGDPKISQTAPASNY